MRKWVVLLIASMLASAGVAKAGPFPADPALSILTFGIAGLAPIDITAGPPGTGTASLTLDPVNNNLVTDTASFWFADDVGPGTSLFTGVPLITDLRVTVRNQQGFFFGQFNPDLATVNGGGTGIDFLCAVPPGPNPPPTCFGGYEGFAGQAVIKVLITPPMGPPVPLEVAIPLNFGGALGAMAGTGAITVTGGPWTTGQIKITNITTNLVTVPLLNNLQGVQLTLGLGTATTVMNVTTGGTQMNPVEVSMVTLEGTNSLTEVGATGLIGSVTLVSPLRIDTGAFGLGVLPGKIEKRFEFVPEPGTLLLLVSGAVGLVAIGRSRMRK